MDTTDLARRFHIAQATAEQRQQFKRIYSHLEVVAQIIDEECPGGRELSLAITKLEEAGMWAVKAIVNSE